QSAANVSITSSSSMSASCAGFCRRIFNIITRPEPISRLTTIVRNLAPYTHPSQETLSLSRRLVACIIATNAAPRELFGDRTGMPVSAWTILRITQLRLLECHNARNPWMGFRPKSRPNFRSADEISYVAIFTGDQTHSEYPQAHSRQTAMRIVVRRKEKPQSSGPERLTSR